MSIPPTDVSNCDLEPIHIPGKIQSHGFLLVTDNKCIIRFISANSKQFIGEEYGSLLDKLLHHFKRLLDMNGTTGFLTSMLSEPAKEPIPFHNKTLLI